MTILKVNKVEYIVVAFCFGWSGDEAKKNITLSQITRLAYRKDSVSL